MIMKKWRSLLIIVCILAVAVFFVYWRGGNSDEKTVDPQPTSSGQPANIEEPQWITAATPFETDASDPQVLWQRDAEAVVAMNLQLYYTSDGVDRQVLHEWTESHAGQAWRNGEYLLIGEQLIEGDPVEGGKRGAWMALRMNAFSTEIVAPLEDQFFGPKDILTVSAAEEPRLFVVRVLNGPGSSEHAFHLPLGEWMRMNRAFALAEPVATPANTDGISLFADSEVFELSDGSSAYSFTDGEGVIIYSDLGSDAIWRYDNHELVHMKLIPFLEQSPQLLGRFRHESGKEFAGFIGASESAIFSIEERLWAEDWQALDNRTFVRTSAEMLEAIRYTFEDLAMEQSVKPLYTKFPLNGAKWRSARGSLMEFERNGNIAYLSWRDLVHTENADPESLWAVPLDRATLLQEELPPYEADWISRPVLEWSFEEVNTNAQVPEELERAVEQAHPMSDYGPAKTYRQSDSLWNVLVDKHLYEYEDGALQAIGDLPITISVTIGEGFGGRGARDFVRLQDGWLVADTEGSRVLRLDDNLEILSKLQVPAPYRMTVDGERVLIASTAYNYITDLELSRISAAEPQPFQSAKAMKEVSFEHFRPQEWYRDAQTGMTWYDLDGWLYQYAKAKGEYRSFYMGYNENARAQVHIVPYEDEVLVLQDRRLDVFDRQGKWLSKLDYPRAQPDGIYDSTTQGESSLIVDEAADLLYYVQGYRILTLDWKRNVVQTLFRQNFADIGDPVMHNGRMYFKLNSNVYDRFSKYEEGAETAERHMYTEVVELNPQSGTFKRFVTDGYYETMELDASSGEPAFTLR